MLGAAIALLLLVGVLTSVQRAVDDGSGAALPASAPGPTAAAPGAIPTADGTAGPGSGPGSPLPTPRSSPNALPAQCPLGTDLSGTARVGPPNGKDLTGYVAARHAVLERCASVAPDVPLLAVVSFATTADAPVTIANVSPATPVAAYVAVPVAGAVPWTLPLVGIGTPGADPLTALRASYSSTSVAFAVDADVRDKAALVAGDDGQRAELAATAVRDRAVQADLVSGCACVYAVAVVATLTVLRALAARPGIRLVDAAPYGTLPTGVQARPLLPSETVQISAAPAPYVFVAASR